MADYGVDCASLWTGTGLDLDPYFREINGPVAVGHAVARRFVTPARSLPWDQAAGLDLRGYLNDSLTSTRALAALVRAEAMKDERVSDAVVSVTYAEATSSLVVAIRGETGDGPFDLVLSADAAAVSLVSLR